MIQIVLALAITSALIACACCLIYGRSDSMTQLYFRPAAPPPARGHHGRKKRKRGVLWEF